MREKSNIRRIDVKNQTIVIFGAKIQMRLLLVHFSGYFNGTSTTTPKCEDQNENGICDDQEDDYDESDEQKAQDDEIDDDYDESDEQKAQEEDYDESDEIKSDDDYEESDEQMAERESKTNKTTTQAPQKNGYELTYHLYEEYLPPPTAPPTPPIIVQTIPHISLNNYFSSHSGQKASLFHPFSPSLNPLVLYVFRQAHSV